MGDMTYDEIKILKSDIKAFNLMLLEYAEKKERSLNANDLSFFTFISKRIIFFKFFSLGSSSNQNNHFFKVLISDFYYLIISLIDCELRYVYVNERSIIECYARLLMHKTVEQDHVTGQLLDSLKDKTYFFDYTEADFSLMKSEYAVACNFIHGGEFLKESLLFIFQEFAEDVWSQDETNDYYERIKRMVKTFDKMLISEYQEHISGCFHRRKTVLEYLLGSDALELLFK
ncbi:hypothetical protein FM106_14025 [Brachybacterium faecium]|nr:hypothetical protein FM106_14025 [Brachybacterium faecium]